jgi:tRNA threonylcarbamoyladenosine biosynthesis protein TsaB
MPRILHIHTALETAIICLSDGTELIGERNNPNQRDHASFLHAGIRDLLTDAGLAATDLDAVQVVHGPGSYTGLRVGMSCAKGLCFSLSIPLITYSTLEWMAAGAGSYPEAWLRCPMIDARRMEVFTALYKSSGDVVMPPSPLILSQDSFHGWLDDRETLFFGNGSEKFREICTHPRAKFETIRSGARELVEHGLLRFREKKFADLAYAEPFYGKAFHSTSTNR